MLFEPGNIVKMIDTYWHGDLNEPRDEIGKLFVIKEVRGTQYGIINMENGNSSYWWDNSQLEFVSEGSLDEIKKCEKIRDDIEKRYNDLDYIKEEILEGNILNLSTTSILKLFHEIGYHSAFERNGEYYALTMDWISLYRIFDALFNQRYDDMIEALNVFKEPYREEYKVKTIDFYNKINQ